MPQRTYPADEIQRRYNAVAVQIVCLIQVEKNGGPVGKARRSICKDLLEGLSAGQPPLSESVAVIRAAVWTDA